jgi:hypothetical protein
VARNSLGAQAADQCRQIAELTAATLDCAAQSSATQSRRIDELTEALIAARHSLRAQAADQCRQIAELTAARDCAVQSRSTLELRIDEQKQRIEELTREAEREPSTSELMAVLRQRLMRPLFG